MRLRHGRGGRSGRPDPSRGNLHRLAAECRRGRSRNTGLLAGMGERAGTGQGGGLARGGTVVGTVPDRGRGPGEFIEWHHRGARRRITRGKCR